MMDARQMTRLRGDLLALLADILLTDPPDDIDYGDTAAIRRVERLVIARQADLVAATDHLVTEELDTDR